MDPETKQWIITVASVVLAPILTFIITVWRLRRLGLNKDNMLIINERAEFRREQIKRAEAQDLKIQRQDEQLEVFRQLNNRLYGRVMYLEAVMKARGIQFDDDDEVRIIE